MAYHKIPKHNQTLRSTRIYCTYCRQNQNWKPKPQESARAFETDIINIRDGSGDQFRGSRTNWGCDTCNIPLCKIGDCWGLWHGRFN